MKFTKQIGNFQAKSDSGVLYTVVELQEYEKILTGAGTISETEGPKKWKTSMGYLLKPIDSETYLIMSSNEVIQKI
jgi:hypothetical protein